MRKNKYSYLDFDPGVSKIPKQGYGGIFLFYAVTAAETTHSLDHRELPEKSNARNDRRTRFECLRE